MATPFASSLDAFDDGGRAARDAHACRRACTGRAASRCEKSHCSARPGPGGTRARSPGRTLLDHYIVGPRVRGWASRAAGADRRRRVSVASGPRVPRRSRSNVELLRSIAEAQGGGRIRTLSTSGADELFDRSARAGAASVVRPLWRTLLLWTDSGAAPRHRDAGGSRGTGTSRAREYAPAGHRGREDRDPRSRACDARGDPLRAPSRRVGVTRSRASALSEADDAKRPAKSPRSKRRRELRSRPSTSEMRAGRSKRRSRNRRRQSERAVIGTDGREDDAPESGSRRTRYERRHGQPVRRSRPTTTCKLPPELPPRDRSTRDAGWAR